jgi:hypothetical protein
MTGMGIRIGEEGLGEFARTQIEAARRDPRLGRDRAASIADFWDAVEEAERARMLGIWGLHELRAALEREEHRLGVRRDDPDLPAAATASLQAAWERAELARGELDNGYPQLNAQALLALNSALDAMIEAFAPKMREMIGEWLTERILTGAEKQEPAAFSSLTAEQRGHVTEAVRSVLREGTRPKIDRMRGSGIERYESVLAQMRLAAPEDRTIPEDLDQALTELGAIRDVLVHRAGRVDAKALEQAPTLRYREGELVRITPDEYRTYSAAIRCYATEIPFRSIRGWPEVTDSDGPDLSRWRLYCRINA